MNVNQKNIIIRLGSISVVLLLGYTLLIVYLFSQISSSSFIQASIIITMIFIGLLVLLWYREKNLYSDYIMTKRINSGHINYMLCPVCKSIQLQGFRKCRVCGEKWISCKVCLIPFEKGSSVLIAPCCGQGFHIEHFEVALRETGECPYCHSTLALNTTNW